MLTRSLAPSLARRKCCLVSKRFLAAAEPLLYADVLLRQLLPLGVPSPHNPLAEKSRYNAFVRALALRPARRALARSVEKAELGLDVVFLARTDLFPNLRRIGAVCWPAVHGPKGELQLMTQDDWRLMRWKLDRDREREVAGLGALLCLSLRSTGP